LRFQLRRPTSPLLTIGFLGDTVPGFPTYKPIKKSRRLLELLGFCDLVIANLESPLTTATSTKDWGSSLCSDPNSVQELKELNVDVANLANNHIIDRGLAGLEETLNVLKQHGISWLGAGRNKKHASKPFTYECTEGKIALLAYSFTALDSPSIANEESPGANSLILNDAKRQLGHLREKGFIVCASYHGGDEFFRIPCPKYRAILKELAQAGAHLVIGHHAHIFQGVEVFNGSIIVYGLGNFYMNTPIQLEHRGTDVGLLLTVEIDRLGPCAYSVNFVHNHRPLRKLVIVEGQKKTELIELFKSISDPLTDPVKWVHEWRHDCCRMALGMNDKCDDLWLLRTARRAYVLSKLFATRASVMNRKSFNNKSQPQSNSSMLEMISAAIMGFPKSINAFKNLRQCYKAYYMEVDS